MSDRIHILPEILCNKIAAGEVVQRPASVVKELVENAIDAAATSIEVSIENGGRDLIQVIDNGDGMSASELPLAFERHATSKIAHVEDLFQINTMGFRGEALPSIASVAMVETVSRQAGEESGYRLEIQAGKVGKVQPIAWEQGTRITVKNLFFNVPARLKFLKTKRTEQNHIIDRLKPLALIYPEIAFKLQSDGKVIYDLRPGSSEERVVDIFGTGYRDKLIQVKQDKGPIQVEGFVGNLDLVRVARGEQYLFVNRRPISDRLLSNAVYQVFRSLIQRGEYPFYALGVTVPPQEVDANVHPTKTEVKFKDEWRVYQVVKDTVEQGMRSKLQMMPSFQAREYDGPPGAPGLGNAPSGSFEFNAPPPGQFESRSDEETQLLDKARQFSQVLERTAQVTQAPKREEAGFIWQVHDKYILSQISSGIAIIDQHVAHERILFEEALRDMAKHRGSGQQLLFPQNQEFSADDYSLLLEMLPSLNDMGFQLREFGPRTILIEAVPPGMRAGSESVIIREMIDYYRENKTFEFSPTKRVAASYACKAAIKAGDPLTEEEMRVLVDRLFATENPFYCPHGRPIIINLSIEELDKRFERH